MNELTLVVHRMEAADDRYGAFTSSHEALGVALEEWTELIAAVQSNELGAVRYEALDLAAVCVRMAEACENDAFCKRSVK